MARTKQTYESPDVAAAAARMVRALVRRAAEGDTEALEELYKLEKVTADAVAEAGRGLHAFGYSWGDLARFTGLTRSACAQRFRDLVA